VAQVVVFSGPAFIWAEAACAALRLVGKPYVLTLHGGALPAFAVRWPGRVRRLLGSADAVTSPSPFLQEAMRAYRGDVRLCPNPLDVGEYPFRLRDRVRPRLIWLRTFHELYNPTLAVRVLARLKPHVRDVELLMVGPARQPESLARVRRLARQLGVEDRLTIAGAVQKRDVASWLNRGDIFLNTTSVDNTPVSVMEALACGLCVVSTDAGGVRVLLRDGRLGLLVPRDDDRAMAAAVRRLLDDPALAGRLSLDGRAAMADLDWSRVLPLWEEILDGAAASSERASHVQPTTKLERNME
jgi:glycosyltransferase involved in cell wall biosynthesis